MYGFGLTASIRNHATFTKAALGQWKADLQYSRIICEMKTDLRIAMS